jgi:hypothetical protein
MPEPIQYYDKTMKQYFPKPIQSQLMSKKTKAIFSRLLHRLSDGWKSWTTFQETLAHTPIEHLSHSDFAKGGEYMFIPEAIRMSIEESPVYQKMCLITVNKREYKIALMYPVDVDTASARNRTNRFFKQAIEKIYMWFYLIAPYIVTGCSITTNIYIFFTDHTKQLASTKSEPLGELHVNTAFTTHCKPNTSVHIYREEEWFKVLMHETLHNTGIDFSAMDDSPANKIILQAFPIQSANGIRLYESYCELWAEMMNITCIAFLTARNKKSIPSMLEHIDAMLKNEMLYSIFQCVKILHHYNLTYGQLTNVNCSVSKKARMLYRENTYVLSYFIAKSILMSQPNHFIEWCMQNNPTIIGFNNTPENIAQYANLVVNESQNDQLLHYIGEFERRLPTIPETDPIVNTLRMTVHELK